MFKSLVVGFITIFLSGCVGESPAINTKACEKFPYGSQVRIEQGHYRTCYNAIVKKRTSYHSVAVRALCPKFVRPGVLLGEAPHKILYITITCTMLKLEYRIR